MTFTETVLPGVYIVDVELQADNRGLFTRTYCEDKFAAQGLCTDWVQCNLSFNTRAGTLRGLHWQVEPYGEAKLVRCTAGAAFDVIADARPESPTYRKWVGLELTAVSRRAVYIPAGYAHGFQTLSDGTELFYHMASRYVPQAATGARWDDPALGIKWPSCTARIIAPRDLTFPDLPL